MSDSVIVRQTTQRIIVDSITPIRRQSIIIRPATSSISVINAGPVGPPGPMGPAAPSLETAIFIVSVPTAVWIHDHTWPGGYPAVTTVDSSGRVIYGDVEYITATRVSITHGGAIAGKTYLN